MSVDEAKAQILENAGLSPDAVRFLADPANTGGALSVIVLQLIGPLQLSFDDPTVTVGGQILVKLTPIPAGSLVLRVWALVETIFALPSGPLFCALECMLASPSADSAVDVALIATNPPSGVADAMRQAARFDEWPTALDNVAIWTRIDKATVLTHVFADDVFLGVQFTEGDGGPPDAPTAGRADVYAIIATPVA